MPSRRQLLGLGVGFGSACAMSRPWAQAASTRLEVVATFSILADLVASVGRERISIATLVGPSADAHVYAPSPADAKRLAGAQLVVANGLGFEGWIGRLIDAAGGGAVVVVATQGIAPRKLPGAAQQRASVDPHAWQAVPNAMVYVTNIRDALTAADPDGWAEYGRSASAYLDALKLLDAEIRTAIASIPPARRRVITSHDAFGYFQDAYGIEFIAPEGVSTDAEPSARDLARIIGQIRKSQVPAVFLENVTDPRLLQRIAAETGARIGGTLFSDALTDANGDAPTYIAMMRHNAKVLTAALAA